MWFRDHDRHGGFYRLWFKIFGLSSRPDAAQLPQIDPDIRPNGAARRQTTAIACRYAWFNKALGIAHEQFKQAMTGRSSLWNDRIFCSHRQKPSKSSPWSIDRLTKVLK
ncbi:hypothetical protein [Acinetobacter sp. A47]|uniref:hypothetical protein n=1 Tax=Acinetobacter sp. A47 TaxID=1561217 RepID=UPI00126A55CE|nr:hypothetical protein [Acinetobacter sp. A47]